MTKRRGLEADPLGDSLQRANPQGLDALLPSGDSESEDAKRNDTVPNSTEINKAPETQASEHSLGPLLPDDSIETTAAETDNRPTYQPVDLSVDLSVDRPIDQPNAKANDLAVMLSSIYGSHQSLRRPVAFYLTEHQDETLSTLVDHFKRAHRIKTDRSALLRAILREPVLNFYDEQTHSEVIHRLTDDATQRLVSAPVN